MKLSLSRCNQAGARLAFALVLMVVTWLMLTPATGEGGMPINDKVAHLLTFGLLSLLAHASWPDRSFDWRFWLPLMTYGIAIECIQYFIPSRSFSLGDMLADAAGIMLYTALLPLVISHSKRHSSAGPPIG